MTKVFINNELFNYEEANVSINDRGYNFGDGVYEIVRFYNGVFFMLEEHLNRFKRSAEEVGITFPYSLEEVKNQWDYLVKTSGYNSGYIYAQLTRGVAKRDHLYIGQEWSPQYVAYAVQEENRPTKVMNEGIKVLITEDIRWLRCDIKSLNLLGSVLVKNKAASMGAKEAVLYRDGKITEGSATNVFMVKNGIVYTHPANNLILNGITRKAVLEIIRKNNIKVSEVPFSLEFFREADEAFTTASVSEIMPIINYDLEMKDGSMLAGIIGKGSRGEITKLIQEQFTQRIEM